MKTIKRATVFKNKESKKGCQFKEWKVDHLGNCDAESFGVVGREHLCKEHFDYALSIKGIHKSQVLDERDEEGNYDPAHV